MKNKVFASIVSIVFLAISCDKKLNISNPNSPVSTDIWTTASGAQAAVNSMYSTYHRVGLARNQFFMNMIRSDEGYSTSPNSALINNFDIFTVTDFNMFERRSFYEDCYVGINRANQVLDNVPNVDAAILNDATKNQYIGEAEFMRALFYYFLADYWGNVPILLHTSTTADQNTPNSTQEEVWAQVEKDLTAAVSLLPGSYSASDLGRATRGAAYALLGKAYMQEHKYAEAETAFAWFITGDGKSLYSLVPNYRDNFVETSENNSESVFEFQNALNPSDNHDDDVDGPTDGLNYGTSIPPFFAPSPVGFTDGQARRWVVWEFLKEATTSGSRDPRLAATFLYDSTDERGPDYTLAYGTPWNQLGLQDVPDNQHNSIHEVCFRKFLDDAVMNGEVFHSGNNYRFIRYADVLLLYAEALNAQGKTANAYQYVDMVRARAGLAALSTVMPNLSQDQFLQQLKHERITELSGEGHRWEDLARWGDLVPQLASRDAGFANFVVGRDELLPIPQQDIDANVNLKQNPGF